jgi:hypothetical protein
MTYLESPMVISLMRLRFVAEACLSGCTLVIIPRTSAHNTLICVGMVDRFHVLRRKPWTHIYNM